MGGKLLPGIGCREAAAVRPSVPSRGSGPWVQAGGWRSGGGASPRRLGPGKGAFRPVTRLAARAGRSGGHLRRRLEKRVGFFSPQVAKLRAAS